MDPSLVIAVVQWSWLIVGLGVLGTLALLLTQEDGDSEVAALWLLLPVLGVGGIGLSSSALSGLGFPIAALWVWRLGGFLYLSTSTAVVVKSKERWARIAGGVNALLAVLLLSATSLGERLFVQNAIAVPTRTPVMPYVVDGVRTWHGIALTILAFGTVFFLVLFVRMVERGVTPQVESNWGGLGGGLGGWRISPSLTYLVAAAVFGVLFAYFVTQLEQDPDDTTPQKTTTAAAQR